MWSRPDVRFAVQWEGKAGTPRGNVYRYSVRNDSDRPVAVALSVEGPARLLDDPEVAVPSRGRVTGTVTVQAGDGIPGEILITATGRGFRIVRRSRSREAADRGTVRRLRAPARRDGLHLVSFLDGLVDHRSSETASVLRGVIGGREILLSITPWPR